MGKEKKTSLLKSQIKHKISLEDEYAKEIEDLQKYW